MKCKKCGTENPADAKFCRNCGHKMRIDSIETPEKKHKSLYYNAHRNGIYKIIKKAVITILVLAVIGGIGFLVWYFSQPYCTIEPDTSKVNFEADGGTIEIPITTDAEYSKWHVSFPSSWLSVSKNKGSITIECSKNTKDKNGSRKGDIRLYCEGRNSRKVHISVTQDESEMFIQGDIISLDIEHNVLDWDEDNETNCKGMKLKVKCNVRHANGEDINCAVWFKDSDGNKLKSTSQNYKTSGGQLTVQKRFCFTDGEDEDVELFIPNSKFPSGTGMYCDVGLFEYCSDSSGRQFASKEFIDKTFNITK